MPQLRTIAAQMQREAKAEGYSLRDLPRGLRLELSWVGGNKTLALSRPVSGILPSADEVAICRGAFGVPNGADSHYGDHTVTIRWPSVQWEVGI